MRLKFSSRNVLILLNYTDTDIYGHLIVDLCIFFLFGNHAAKSIHVCADETEKFIKKCPENWLHTHRHINLLMVKVHICHSHTTYFICDETINLSELFQYAHLATVFHFYFVKWWFLRRPLANTYNEKMWINVYILPILKKIIEWMNKEVLIGIRSFDSKLKIQT